MSLRRLLPLCILALALVPAARATADQAEAEIGRQTPVAAYGGWEAWSSYDGATGRYTLMVAAPGQPAAPIGDIDLVAPVRRLDGPGSQQERGDRLPALRLERLRRPPLQHGERQRREALLGLLAVLQRGHAGHLGRERRLHAARPRLRRARTSRTSSSSASSRRLLKSKCLQTDPGHVSIRGTRIVISSVDTSGADANGAGVKVAELRRYSATASGSQVMVRQSFGEESNYFGQVAQDDRFAYTVRVGVHQANTFMRVPFAGGKPEEARAFRTLTGAFAKPAANSSLYVESQGGEETSCDGFTDIPCRIVLAPAPRSEACSAP